MDDASLCLLDTHNQFEQELSRTMEELSRTKEELSRTKQLKSRLQVSKETSALQVSIEKDWCTAGQ